jgi:hypothetical protein
VEELYQLKQQLGFITYTIGESSEDKRHEVNEEYKDEILNILKRIRELTNGQS